MSKPPMFVPFVLFFVLALGCAKSQSVNYLARPLPATEEQRQAECLWIRQEIARQRSIVNYAYSSGNPYAAIFQTKAGQNIAQLEARAAQIRCHAAFSNTIPPASTPDKLSFDECFKKCKELTGRTREDCFDSCSGR